MSRAASRVANINLPKQQGEVARLRVVGGPDFGAVFLINAPKVTIGRGQENDIILSDLKVSRRHAEITINAFGAGPGNALIRDLGSSHGVLINGKQQQSSALKTGDKIGIGTTVIEYFGSERGVSRLMVVPPPTTAPVVGTGDSGLTKFVQSSRMPRAFGGRSVSGVAGGAQTLLERNKKPVLILATLIALSALLPQVENQRKKRSVYVDPKDQINEALTALVPAAPDPNAMRAAELHFKEGFREFRARNYLRAQVAFETALQVWGDHNLARIYLESTKKAMDGEAKKFLEDAKRDEEANRVRSARLNYEAVMRLFAKDKENGNYKEAQNRLLDLEKMIKDREK